MDLSLASDDVLRATRVRMATLSEGDLPLWGTMTVSEMARHLSMAYEMALGMRAAPPVKGSLPPWAMKWMGLRSGFTWPKGVQTVPELKRALAEKPAGLLAANVRDAVTGMDALATGPKWASTHPFFGKMTPADWKRWGYLHADHHLRQFGR